MFNFGLLEYSLIAFSGIVLILLIWLGIMKLRKFHLSRHYQVKFFYKYIRKVAVYQDYYLINKLELQISDQQSFKVDHLLFGNKYIYVINDYFHKGKLLGKKQDGSWILKTKKGNEIVIKNPMQENSRLLKQLHLITSIDEMQFVGITLVNNETDINELNVNEKDNYIIDLRDFAKLVKSLEGRDIKVLNQEELQKRVLEIDRLNVRRKRGRKWR